MPNNIFEKINEIETVSLNIIKNAKFALEKEINDFKASWDNEIKQAKLKAKEEGLRKIKHAEEEAKKEIALLEKDREQKLLNIQSAYKKNKEEAKITAFERFKNLCQL